MARARVLEFEHELGSGARASRATPPALAGALTRQLIGYRHTSAPFQSFLETPRVLVTIMIDLEGSILANGRPLPTAWIGGLMKTYTVVGFSGTYSSIDLKLDPLSAGALLGMPISELGLGCVALGDAFGPAGAELVDRIREATTWDGRFDALEHWMIDRLRSGRRPDPMIARALTRLVGSAGSLPIESLAAELGVSRRYLAAGFAREVGLSPKVAARQLRFAEVRRQIEQTPSRWADIAAGAGYADQSHLNREFRALAGMTPTEFVARRIPSGGLVGDGIAPR